MENITDEIEHKDAVKIEEQPKEEKITIESKEEEENLDEVLSNVTSTKEEYDEKDLEENLKEIKKTAGLIHNPSELLSIDSLVYYEKARKINLTDFEGQNKLLKDDLKKIKGIAETYWKEIYDKIKDDEKTKDMRQEEIKIVCDTLMKTKIDNEMELLSVKYPFLQI